MEEELSELSTEARHKKEKKELQAQIQALKKSAKNDKSKKKEFLAEITRLELELENRHKEELDHLDKVDEVQATEETNVEDVIKTKISKAQKRRDKKSLNEKKRAEEIKLQEKENVNGPRNIEIQAIGAKLRERNLTIYHVPSDGDCLYKAIAHQMIITRNKLYSVAELRHTASEYIEKNKNDFLPFMSHPDTFEMLSDTEFKEYCDKISSTKAWGGQLEIRALSNSLKCPISIIQATGPESIEQGVEFEGPPLVLSYHRHMYQLGEHYNSTKSFSEYSEISEQNDCN